MSESTIDFDLVSHHVRDKIKDGVRTYSDIACLSREEAFEAYLNGNGIYGYGKAIREALFEIITASYDHITSTDQVDSNRLRKFVVEG